MAVEPHSVVKVVDIRTDNNCGYLKLVANIFREDICPLNLKEQQPVLRRLK